MSTPGTPGTTYGCCCQPVSIFSGMTTAQLQALLLAAQGAYTDLLLGQKGVSFSYTQGDGARAVTYAATNTAQLLALIRQLQQALGMICHARRPARFIYR
jgi:gpW